MRIKLLAPILLLMTVSLASCGGASDTATSPNATGESVASQVSPSPSPEASPAGTVLSSSEGNSQITLPEGWVEDRELHEEAQIQASDRSRELYILVLSEDKSDFGSDMTLAKHSEITRGILTDNLTDVSISGPTEVTTVNGNAATQYQIDGTISGINVTYLHTTVETPERYNQVLAWTLPSDFEKNKAEMQQVIASFQGN